MLYIIQRKKLLVEGTVKIHLDKEKMMTEMYNKAKGLFLSF
jgi:hypothetical protein